MAVKISAGLDCEAVSPLGSVTMPVYQFHAADCNMNTRVVLPRGFGVAAGFCVFQLWVQEGTATSALATSHPDSVAESFLNVGDVIVRRQDTSRTRVHVVMPLVGGLSVAQVLNPGYLLPGTRDRSVSRESCAWNVAMSRLFRGAEKSMSSLSSSWEAELGCSRDAMVGFATPGPCSLPNVCCHASSAALGCLLNIQLRRCLCEGSIFGQGPRLLSWRSASGKLPR